MVLIRCELSYTLVSVSKGRVAGVGRQKSLFMKIINSEHVLAPQNNLPTGAPEVRDMHRMEGHAPHVGSEVQCSSSGSVPQIVLMPRNPTRLCAWFCEHPGSGLGNPCLHSAVAHQTGANRGPGWGPGI